MQIKDNIRRSLTMTLNYVCLVDQSDFRKIHGWLNSYRGRIYWFEGCLFLRFSQNLSSKRKTPLSSASKAVNFNHEWNEKTEGIRLERF